MKISKGANTRQYVFGPLAICCLTQQYKEANPGEKVRPVLFYGKALGFISRELAAAMLREGRKNKEGSK